MIFFDTNVLVYYTVNQNKHKQRLSEKLIEEAIRDDYFFISPLVMTEYIFILSKLKIRDENSDKISFFNKFVKGTISNIEITEAYKICQKIDFCRNINDAIHLVIAQKYCHKLITFDSDFKRFIEFMNIDIEVLS